MLMNAAVFYAPKDVRFERIDLIIRKCCPASSHILCSLIAKRTNDPIVDYSLSKLML